MGTLTRIAISRAGLLGLLAIAPQIAHATLEQDYARGSLEREIALIDRISPHVERVDQPRVDRTRRLAESSLKEINLHGMGNVATIEAFRALVLTCRYSGDLWAQIRTERTGSAIDEIQKITEKFAADRGFDEPTQIRVTYDVFQDMHSLLGNLENLEVSQSLRDHLAALRSPVGNVIAAANLGDQAQSFSQALAVYLQIQSLYPELDRLPTSSAVFHLVNELIGLAEFYADYAHFSHETEGAL